MIFNKNIKHCVLQIKKFMSSKSFETLNFDNLVLKTLPIDPVTENYVRQVKNACFSKVFLNY